MLWSYLGLAYPHGREGTNDGSIDAQMTVQNPKGLLRET